MPADLDIFPAFKSKWPIMRMHRGHLLGFPLPMAVRLYRLDFHALSKRWPYCRLLANLGDRIVRSLPVDLDIFSALSRRWPLVRMERGHLLGSLCQIAVWLYRAKLR